MNTQIYKIFAVLAVIFIAFSFGTVSVFADGDGGDGGGDAGGIGGSGPGADDCGADDTGGESGTCGTGSGGEGEGEGGYWNPGNPGGSSCEPNCPPTCIDTLWLPLADDICAGVSFVQISNCSNTRSAVGTKDCSGVCFSDNWQEPTDTECVGVAFIQYNDCGEIRDAIGTKDCGGCVPTEWLPETSEYCVGEYFIQNDGCGHTRSAEGSSTCDTVPQVNNIQANNSIDYCSYGPDVASLSWDFVDPDPRDYQYARRFACMRISDSLNVGTEKSISSSEFITISDLNLLIESNSGEENFVWYDSSQLGYSCQIKVWDSTDRESAWSDSVYFATPKHRYPSVSFDWTPTDMSVGENVQFNSSADPRKAECYDNNNDAIACQSYWWDFSAGASPSTSVEQDPLVQFLTMGYKTVWLMVTDFDNYQCVGSATSFGSIDVKNKLPRWREILPF